VSRGHGYLQRRILRLVEKAQLRGDAPLTRRDLENRLEPEGYRSDNVLRAIRGLSRAGLAEFREARFAANSVVSPPKPFAPFSDEEIMNMLSEPGWRQIPDAPTRRERTPDRPRSGKKNPRVCEEMTELRVEASPAAPREIGSPDPGREGRATCDDGR